jgi:hypothetical protein
MLLYYTNKTYSEFLDKVDIVQRCKGATEFEQSHKFKI